jgi:integral membrane sensor domain MASE1/anti-sigma regulatory factor (Ser/Thr protein kinase)
MSTPGVGGTEGTAPARLTKRDLLEMILLGVAYYVAARLSLRFALIQQNVTPLWPPTGIALFAFLRYGRRLWPGVALAAFLVNLPISASLAAAATAAGNVLAPLLASWVLERVDFHHALDRVRDVVALVFLGALASMTISATIGTTALVLSDRISGSGFWPAWSVWWTGDAMGVLVIAPFLLCLALWPRLGPRFDWRRAAEAAVLFALLAAASMVAVRGGSPLLFLVPPLVGWIAWRFQLRGAAPAVLMVSCFAVWSPAESVGWFADLSLARQMLTLQLFNGTVAFTAFFVSALMSERIVAREQLERAAANLGRTVETRTGQLSASHRALAEAQELAQLGRWSWDFPTGAVSWSDEMFGIYGLTPGTFALSFDTVMEPVLEDDRRRIVRNLVDAVAEKREILPDVEYRIVRPDGEVRALIGRGRMSYSEGAPARMVGVVQDVTERREYEREHRIAETLQRALLPQELPAIDGFSLAASYVPAEVGFKAGGDWYDVIPLADGRVGLVIGDVSGHGLEAASLMGQLRMAVQAYALEGHGPETMVARADALLCTVAPDELATMLYAEIDSTLGTMRVISAGHPPPIVVADGRARYLEPVPDPPLGFSGPRRGHALDAAIEPGTLVLLYTDGLVDRRDLPLVEGLDRLLAAVQAAPDRSPPDLCRDLMTVLVPDRASDDIAVLALEMVAVSGPFAVRIPAEPEELARVRRRLARWLSASDVDRDDADALVLACSEACANAIRHAYGPGDGVIEVKAKRVDGAVEITVKDAGHWRHRQGVGGGLGLGLIESLANSVTVDESNGNGTVVTMRRSVGKAVST